MSLSAILMIYGRQLYNHAKNLYFIVLFHFQSLQSFCFKSNWECFQLIMVPEGLAYLAAVPEELLK